MTLRVWLPLNDNIVNQGLSDTILTSSNLTYEDGKIGGKCAKFNNSYILLKNPPLNTNTKEFSFAFWYKTTSPSSTQCLYNGRTVTGGAVGLFVFEGKFRLDDGTQHGFNYAVPNNQWHHYVFTRDTTSVKLYVDGILQQSGNSADFTCEATYASIGMSTANTSAPYYNNLMGNLQDYRIYDHCLSVKEVKELSKGLSIHLPLSWGGNPNLFTNSITVNNSSGNITNYTHETIQYDDGIVRRFTDKTGTGYGPWGNGFNKGTQCILGKTYTWSIEARVSKNRTMNFGHECGGTRNVNLTTEWNKFTHTWTASYGDSTHDAFIFFGGWTEIGAWLEVRNLKIEEGTKATPWIPKSSDAIYSSKAFNDIVGQDCSGYNRNAITYEGSNDYGSPRYSSCTNFKSADKFTLTPSLALNQQLSEFTTCIWAKTNTTNSTSPNLISLGQNYFWRFRITTTGTSIWYYIRVGSTQCSSTYTTKNLLDNLWHHYAVTFKNGVVTAYIDGKQVGQTDHSATATYTTCAGTNWILHAFQGTTESFVGSLSDCRIYHTCLSADDIKELYETPISIDKTGKLFCNNLVEE